MRAWLWLINDDGAYGELSDAQKAGFDWLRLLPFVAIHLACLGVFFVGVSPVALGVAVGLYVLRMFFVTAFFHRYFSHRAFTTSRPMQFAMAVLGCTAGQRGPLWWAGHHREHHISSDTPADPHSPRQHGFLYAHTLWFLTRGSFPIQYRRVRDFARFPELKWLERFDWVPFVLLAVGCWWLGAALETRAPALGTSGAQMLVWGFFVSTVVLYHATYTINSLAHGYGRRRYETGDDSRNNAWLALLTLGEGWHNNHHRYPGSASQGFYWYELDLSYLGLRALALVGLVDNLRTVPAEIRDGIARQ